MNTNTFVNTWMAANNVRMQECCTEPLQLFLMPMQKLNPGGTEVLVHISNQRKSVYASRDRQKRYGANDVHVID